MPDKDYAYNDPDAPAALVPQALTAYRHFAVREEDRQVFPMNQYGYVSSSPMAALLGTDRSCYRIPGVHESRWDEPDYGDDRAYEWKLGSPSATIRAITPAMMGCTCSLCRDIAYKQQGTQQSTRRQPPRPVPESRPAEVFTAACGRSPQSGMKFTFFFPGAEKEPHDSPGDGCSCGFYAHYGPDADFYEGTQWYPNETMTLVRTVVELSGRVVLGTKGVRAQKMKMLAMAVDWEKMSRKKRADPYEELVSMSGWRVAEPPRSLTYEEERAIQYRTRAAVESTAKLYGVKYYDDAQVMYKDYPQPDIRHLFPEETPDESEA